MQTVFSLSLQDGTRSTSYDPIKSLLKTTAEATSQFTCLRLSSSAKGSFWDAPKQKFLCLVDTEAERQPESEGAQLHSTQLPKAWKGRGKEAKLTQTPHSICTREMSFSGLDAISALHCGLTGTAPHWPHCSKPTRVICRAHGISRKWIKHCWRHWRIGPSKPVCQMLLQSAVLGHTSVSSRAAAPGLAHV